MQALLQEISGIGVLPVIRQQEAEHVTKIVKILERQAFPVVEIAMRSSATLALIKELKQQFPHVTIGLSNILTDDQIEDALEAHVDFISTIEVSGSLIEKCMAHQLPVIPECATSVDLDYAKAIGVECVKLLANTPLSDLKMVKELSERYKGMHFVLAPGIETDKIVDYLSLDSVVACCVSGQHPKKDQDWDYVHIEEEAQAMMKDLLGMKLDHVGINAGDKTQTVLQQFSHLLNEKPLEATGSYFIGDTVELMKEDGRGQVGHIGYKVNHLKRAMHYFIGKGYHFDESSFRYDENGELYFAYFQETIGGFAIHLKQK